MQIDFTRDELRQLELLVANAEGRFPDAFWSASKKITDALDAPIRALSDPKKCADEACVLYGLYHVGQPCKLAAWALQPLREGEERICPRHEGPRAYCGCGIPLSGER